MRTLLQNLDSNKRYTFNAEFSGVGFKRVPNRRGVEIFAPTIVFKNVQLDGQVITDHLWFNYTKGFGILGELNDGDKIQFDGRITNYQKGYYMHKTLDYKITYPSKIKRMTPTKNPIVMPLISNAKNALIGYIMQENKDFYLKTGRPFEPWYIQQYRKWQTTQSTTKEDTHDPKRN